MFGCPSILDVLKVLINGLIFPIRIFIIVIMVMILVMGAENWMVFIVFIIFLSPRSTTFFMSVVSILIDHCSLAHIAPLIEPVKPGLFKACRLVFDQLRQDRFGYVRLAWTLKTPRITFRFTFCSKDLCHCSFANSCSSHSLLSSQYYFVSVIWLGLNSSQDWPCFCQENFLLKSTSFSLLLITALLILTHIFSLIHLLVKDDYGRKL